MNPRKRCRAQRRHRCNKRRVRQCSQKRETIHKTTKDTGLSLGSLIHFGSQILAQFEGKAQPAGRIFSEEKPQS